MNYYDELPEGYTEAWSIDAGDKKAGIILNVVALVIAIAIIVPGYFIERAIKEFSIDFGDIKTLIVCGAFLFVTIVYIILHELVHGLFYKIFTHKKLTFGIKLTCAYCGVPTIYAKKIPMIITALAPLVVFTIPSIIALILLPADIIFIAVLVFFALHFSGCVGDIYVSFMLLKYPKDVLVNDTGAKQTFYVKK